MNITLKRTNEQLELVQAMASKNRDVAYEAQVALAEFIGPVINEVVNNAPTLSNLFTPLQFNADDNPSIPLDVYYDVADEDYINVYSSHAPGGLPTNQVTPSHNEVKLATYKLATAVSFEKKYASRSRMDVGSKSFTRAAQEILLKQDRTAFNVLATALIKATTISAAGGSAAAGNHITTASANDRFVLADFNKLITLSNRINSSFVGGTPVGGSKAGITEIMCSPEMVEQLRGMAYNPINTANSPSGTTGGDGFVAPDSLREQLYSAAGLPAFYGINIMEQLELGKSQRFNKIFASINAAEGSPVSNFASNDDEILIGVDRSKDALIRPVVLDEGNTGDLSVLVDDQFSVRQNKIGYYGKVEEGRVCIDDRALVGLHVELT